MESERDLAIRMAQQLYQERRDQGMDFTDGPCLAEEIIPDWCVDVAHSPRRDVDNLPQNQCQSWLAKQVHHFVELDPDGNVIRTV